MPKLLLVTAHYGDASQLRAFDRMVSAISNAGVSGLHAAVADNSVTGVTGHEYTALKIFRPKRNLGYLNGCHFGLEQFLNRERFWPDWIGVVNTDIVLEPASVRWLLEYAPSPDIAAIGPDIRLTSGIHQNPFMRQRPSKWRMRYYRAVFSHPRSTAALETLAGWKTRCLDRASELELAAAHQPSEVYAVHGSAFFLSRVFFECGGSLRFPGFLYGEEIYIAEQARRLDLKILYCPAIRVLHREHSSTGQQRVAQRASWARQSVSYLCENYFP
jgi:GT2 family glycosyltransferase